MIHYKVKMPLYKHDRLAYVLEMYEWHQALSSEPGGVGVHHLERANEYRSMLEKVKDTELVDTIYY